jgi:Flp pilus assembly protein TadB
MVLTFLPALTLLMLKLVSPTYIDALTDDPVVRNFLGAGIVSQIVGYLVMKKMIRVEV